MRSLLLAALLAMTTIAGCSGGASSSSGDDGVPDGAFDDFDGKPTDTTGIVRGIVVDEAIAPLEGVTVRLQGPSGNREATTSALGAFGFDDLDPGTYFVNAQKAGYSPAQQSVEVAAGEEDPPVVKILLGENPSTQPYYDVYVFEGYIECSATYVLFFSSCRNPVDGSPIGNNDYERNFAVPGALSFLHVSLVWEPTQPFGTELYFNVCEDVGPCESAVAYTGGPGPLVADIPEEALGPINAIGQFGIEVAGNGEAGTGVGLELQQDFTAYGVAFRNFVPPEGYAFWRDGEPKLSA